VTPPEGTRISSHHLKTSSRRERKGSGMNQLFLRSQSFATNCVFLSIHTIWLSAQSSNDLVVIFLSTSVRIKIYHLQHCLFFTSLTFDSYNGSSIRFGLEAGQLPTLVFYVFRTGKTRCKARKDAEGVAGAQNRSTFLLRLCCFQIESCPKSSRDMWNSSSNSSSLR